MSQMSRRSKNRWTDLLYCSVEHNLNNVMDTLFRTSEKMEVNHDETSFKNPKIPIVVQKMSKTSLETTLKSQILCKKYR